MTRRRRMHLALPNLSNKNHYVTSQVPNKKKPSSKSPQGAYRAQVTKKKKSPQGVYRAQVTKKKKSPQGVYRAQVTKKKKSPQGVHRAQVTKKKPPSTNTRKQATFQQKKNHTHRTKQDPPTPGTKQIPQRQQKKKKRRPPNARNPADSSTPRQLRTQLRQGTAGTSRDGATAPTCRT